MKIPNIQNYPNDGNKIEYKFIEKPEPIEASFHIMNDKEKLKLIYQVEAFVRGSLEYKQFIQYLKSEVDMTYCTFFENLNNTTSNISIEIHHAPFTLFDIASTVVEKYIDEELELNPLILAEEVAKIHYQNMVGLIPLSKTVHQLAHDGKIFIPLQNIYGSYSDFISAYDKWIPEEAMSSLRVVLDMSKDINNLDTSILDVKYVYLEVDGFLFPTLKKEEV